MALGAYRTTLVWVLRVGAMVVLVSTLGTLALTIRDAAHNPPLSTLYGTAQLLVNPLVILAVAEILALLNKRSSAN
ncbi:MAG: hypothetical protein KF779_10235 [Hyphomonadaceae bacterium]|nr:hypothetical protein [Hyphomonadaceae bacterium]